jgi:hypothetical protein
LIVLKIRLDPSFLGGICPGAPTANPQAGRILFFIQRGRRYGIEANFIEAPKATRSMKIALDDLGLAHLWVIYLGQKAYPVQEKITVWPLQELQDLPGHIG